MSRTLGLCALALLCTMAPAVGGSAGAADPRPGVDAAVPVNFGSFATARVAGAFLTGTAATRSGWRQDVTFASRRSGIGGV